MKPHPCMAFESGSVVESLAQQSSCAESSCFANVARAPVKADVALRSWEQRSCGCSHCIRICWCWMLLMSVGLRISRAPISSVITWSKPSPLLPRLEPEQSLTSQRQLGDPKFPITSTAWLGGIFSKKLKPSVPGDKLVFIMKYYSCIVHDCSVWHNLQSCSCACCQWQGALYNRDLYHVKIFMILREQKEKYFRGAKSLLGNYSRSVYKIACQNIFIVSCWDLHWLTAAVLTTEMQCSLLFYLGLIGELCISGDYHFQVIKPVFRNAYSLPPTFRIFIK